MGSHLDIELVDGCVAQGEGEGSRVCTGAAHVYVSCNKSVGEGEC